MHIYLLLLKYIIILPYFLKDSKQVLTIEAKKEDVNEKKNKKKKAAIIAGIIGASTLIGGGGIAAATIGITEAETKVEENEREEEEKKKKTRSGKKTVNNKQDLSTALPQTKRNLGTIATNGKDLTVEMIKAKLPANIQNEVDINIQGNKATLTAKATSTDYQGTVEVTFTVNNRVIQQDTIYIDKHGQQRTTNERSLSNIETTEIIQIGFYKNEKGEIQVVQIPITIKKVPDQLPSEITSINNMFWKCKLFNQDISNWDNSNVTDMSYMFGYHRYFDQDLSKWNLSNKVIKYEYFADWSKIANTKKLPKFGA